ncbi:uncharacterized protein A1O9_05244 [Exophiala aquamarina CBS 119918]|uniref:F-box domain-containing protein n=1 Tax=Exophiala aquamarina CBS 119918 TaxID=1182545 RepID=A0A072PC54_9EURO|nr:uncharacterized protein A1O9_05244 [Exophiala aquamarina CBS 119918]KEF57327.1 hypothetical protein A1O9_05244 [Exophiala aquamarina CBS 119918]
MLIDLPFDVLHQIARCLDVRSHHNLGKTCHLLHEHLKDENTARHCLEQQSSIRHSTWARLALSAPTKGRFRQLLDRCLLQKESVQKASPYSATIIGHGTSFVYGAGVLCYANHEGIRILDLNRANATEKVLSGRFFCSKLSFEGSDSTNLDPEDLKSVQVCSYSDMIVICLCNFGLLGHFLFAVNIDEEFKRSPPCLKSSSHDRILLRVRVRSTNRLFVRHDSRHLVYGTYSARGLHDHREWLLEVYDLGTGKAVSKEPLQLQNFYGSDVGSTACFTISEGQFYAVTNQTSLESEEVDWTSYYHFTSFPLDEPSPDLRIRVIWRRQHVEGPINDAWTLLEFQHDHRTGESLIVECRKEWINGGSRSFRTFYSQPFRRAQHQELTDGLRHPPDDPLSKTLDKENNSRYEAPRPRAKKYVHTEAGASGAVKEYIRAKTKWNGYCFNSQSFVDIVTEEYRIDDDWRPRERIKVRVVSREEISPLVQDTVKPRRTGGLIVRPRIRDREGHEMLDGEEDFTASHISLWPSDDAPQLLHDILCPGGRAGEVKAILGDEGLIYMAGPPVPGGHGERALVFVSFDPTFGFEGMTRLDGTPAHERRRDKEESTPSTATKKRKPPSHGGQEGDNTDCPPDKGEGHSHDFDSPSLPDRTKRIKAHDQKTRGALSTTIDLDRYSIVSGPAMAALAPTPLALPPALPSQETSEIPSFCPFTQEGATKNQPSSSDLHARHPSDGGRSTINSTTTTGNTSLASSIGLLTWREKAKYLSIAKSVWTR